jgi:SLT domain-containing protein
MAGAQAAGAGVGAGIAALAEGGIVDRPTLALIGEAGPEAVIPLGGSTRNLMQQERQPINIQKVELFPNVTEGDALFSIPRTTLERWLRRDVIPVMNQLNERGLRPVRGRG